MNSREQFEAWAYAEGWRTFKRLSTGQYAQDSLNYSWDAWQAAERHAFEIAARICGDYEYTDAAERMIRAYLPDAKEPKGMVGCKECTDEPECAWHQICQRKENAGFREVGVWEPDGRKFMTYAPENLNGKAMYVKEAK